VTKSLIVKKKSPTIKALSPIPVTIPNSEMSNPDEFTELCELLTELDLKSATGGASVLGTIFKGIGPVADAYAIYQSLDHRKEQLAEGQSLREQTARYKDLEREQYKRNTYHAIMLEKLRDLKQNDPDKWEKFKNSVNNEVPNG